jgi:hypothetical protein
MSTFINPYNFVRPGKPSERKPYVSHKKFTGLSGVIVCKLRTLTPMFTPDPKTTSPGDDGKRNMKFFKANGELAIPGSSLKGMIRSVAEAVSNSCFSVFDDSDFINSYMIYRNTDPRPSGIMIFKGGNWFIQKVEEIVVRATAVSGKDGDVVWFHDSGEKHRYRRVTKNVSNKATKECDEKGILKKYYKGIPGKSMGFRIAVESGNNYEVPEDVVDHYYKVIKHHDFSKEKISDSERGYLEALDGSFVYFEPDESTKKVKSFGKNFRYKWLGKYTPMELLKRDSPDFLPCKTRDKLCVCCRMFGTVGDGENQVAGRIFLTDAKLDSKEPQMMSDIRLRTLEQPRPKYYPFYLIGETGTTRPVKKYDHEDSVLRGRKFYWHHPPGSKYYEDPQGNSQVELLPKDTEFSFCVEFMNLNEIELGLLIYSLELDGIQGNMAHKIGMGKPIGLGSVKIVIQSCDIQSSISRYCNTNTVVPNKDECVSKFKDYMKSVNGLDFSEISNIVDMRNILSIDILSADVVYPPVPKGGKYEEYEGYGWFMEDRKESPLPTSTDVRNNKNMLEEKNASPEQRGGQQKKRRY